MTRHIIPFTYLPKIPAVLDGRCKQTIRHLGKLHRRPGNSALLHGWDGKPYYSHWDWRIDVKLDWVADVVVIREGIKTNDNPFDGHETKTAIDYPDGKLGWVFEWDQIDWLAELDFISPPTGKELGRVLISKNKEIRKNGFMPAQIIRWL